MKHPTLITFNKIKYDLSHLQEDNYTMILHSHKNNPELKVEVNIKYSNHCYSEGTTIMINRTHDFSDHNDWPRYFSIDRYKTSLLLPSLVKQLGFKKCLFTGKSNWVVIELQSCDGENVPFHIYFSIKKNKYKKNGLFIIIESAYLKTKGDNSPRRKKSMDRISFAMLARKTLSGQPIKQPPHRR